MSTQKPSMKRLISQLDNSMDESSELANINEQITPDYGVVVKNSIGTTVA